MENTVLIERTLQNGTKQQLNIAVVTSRLSKSFLNKIIKWSSSRYETWKKHEVVEHILFGMKNGGHTKKHYDDKMNIIEKTFTTDYFHSGSYCECSSMTRKGTYYVDYSKKVLIDCDDADSNEITKIYAAYQF